jgi:multidrug efflux pump
MNFTDLFIKRPVLSCVVSLFIFLLGMYGISQMPLREYPATVNTEISVTTAYPGASADLVQGFITQPLTQAISQADGIDYMTATSTKGTSTISVYMKMNYDPNAALSEVLAKVQQVVNTLPSASQQPVIEKSSGDSFALMYIGFSSKSMTPEQVTDYLTRVVQPKIQSIDGISQAAVLGGMTYSMRIWLDPDRMVALGVTSSDVKNALTQNNFQAAAGQTKGKLVLFNVSADTDLHGKDSFDSIVIANNNGKLIRIKDVATVELGSESYDTSVKFDNEDAVFLGLFTTPEANPLTVINNVSAALPVLKKNYPNGLTSKVVYDGTRYIKASLNEVIETILIAGAIVILVIFAFLGSLRTVMIPVITMPLSMVGVCFLMLILGYSLNLLTLLAMVLAIGLVVDDAIVVVENIYRHIEEGKTPREAALVGAREIASPIITMTITLAAVYAPIGFIGGLTGALFTEFAFTLAGAVIISGILALTLSPMMCSKVLTNKVMDERFVIMIDKFFDKVRSFYTRRLTATLKYRPVTIVFAAIILISCYFLATTTQTELAPKEDQSALWIMLTGPKSANIDYMNKFTSPLHEIFDELPQTQDYFVINGSNGVNSGIGGLILKPWDERKKSEKEIKGIVQGELYSSLSGLEAVAFEPPSLPGSTGGLPVQFVITSTTDYQTLYKLQEDLAKAAKESGLFAYTSTTLKYNNPELNILIDRDKAGDMGINMETLGDELSILLGDNYVNLFSMENRSYKVIPQVAQKYRFNPKNLNDYYTSTSDGTMIPLSNIVKIGYSVEPNTLNTFQQLNSATVQGVMVPGNTTTDGLNFLINKAEELFPKGVTYGFEGESRQVMQEGDALLYSFFFALVVIYLVLAAKFESWTDPLVILISVPMSISGALIPLNMGLSTLNIYSGIGLVTLIGLISKHGILMVEFANVIQREEGLKIRDAIIKSASFRLRPVLMTTFAMVFGVFPLLTASGAGAISRFDIGLVIAVGMSIGTLFTLFVVPTVYTFLAKDHSKEHFD